MYQQASHMIIVRIETDIAPPCAPQQLLLYKATGIFFTQTPPLVETLAGAFGYACCSNLAKSSL